MIYRIARKKQLPLSEKGRSQGKQLVMEFDNDPQTIYWHALSRSAEKYFKIWLPEREVKWMEWVWQNLLEAGLATFTDERSKLEVYLRFYAIGEITAEFFRLYFKLSPVTKEWSVFELLNDVDGNISRWAGYSLLSETCLQHQSREISRKEIHDVLMKKYTLRDPFDAASEIFFEMASIWDSDEDFRKNLAKVNFELLLMRLENAESYEGSSAGKMKRVKQWILEGMQHENY